MGNKLDYGTARGYDRTIFRRIAWLAATVVFLVALVFVDQICRSSQNHIHAEREKSFRLLEQLASQMIRERAGGVVLDNGEWRVRSFDDLFDYVAKCRPDAVSSRTASNPFPGLLIERDYGHRARATEKGSDDLFWSNEVRHATVGALQLRLKADGTAGSFR